MQKVHDEQNINIFNKDGSVTMLCHAILEFKARRKKDK